MNGESHDKFKRVLFAAAGLIETTRKKSSALYEELIERGKIRRSDSREYLKKILNAAREEKNELKKIMDKKQPDESGLKDKTE